MISKNESKNEQIYLCESARAIMVICVILTAPWSSERDRTSEKKSAKRQLWIKTDLFSLSHFGLSFMNFFNSFFFSLASN